MQQSQFLIKALEATEAILNSESSDLKELAEKAAKISGIPAKRILMKVDLSGINLKGKDVDYLVDKGAFYHTAGLTAEQYAMFEKGERQHRALQVRKEIRSARIYMIEEFIESCELKKSLVFGNSKDEVLEPTFLRAVLMDSFQAGYSAGQPLGDDYAKNVLTSLGRFASDRNLDFFVNLFGLLKFLQCEIGPGSRTVILNEYYSEFGFELGDLIGNLWPQAELDAQWILAQSIKDPWFPKEGGIGHERLFNQVVGRAAKINQYRDIHTGAIEKIIDSLENSLEAIIFLEHVDFGCSNDDAERIALRLVRGNWPATSTKEMLNAKINTKVHGAMFRQIIQQGNVERTLALLRWLNRNRGGIGALSLDDALSRIDSFAALFDFASEVYNDLTVKQAEVLREALNRTAKNPMQRSKVQRLLSE